MTIGDLMSAPSTATLYRIAAYAGIGSGLVLLINAAKRSGLIPVTAATQLIAPLAQVLALALIAGLYFAYTRRTGTFGLTAYLLNAGALAALVGVEFVINLVFAELPANTIAELRAGPLGIALTVASISFLLGTLAFAVALLMARKAPAAAVTLYALGAVPVALRAAVPEWALNAGLVAMAVGIGWLSVRMLRDASTHAETTTPAVAVA